MTKKSKIRTDDDGLIGTVELVAKVNDASLVGNKNSERFSGRVTDGVGARIDVRFLYSCTKCKTKKTT